MKTEFGSGPSGSEKAYCRSVNHHFGRTGHNRGSRITDSNDAVGTECFGFFRHPLCGNRTGFIHHVCIGAELASDQRFQSVGNVVADVFGLNGAPFNNLNGFWIFPEIKSVLTKIIFILLIINRTETLTEEPGRRLTVRRRREPMRS